ncbi:hypothetical protein lpp0712 [Legionella pneumophila str. Paris]|nr:hypothetical protein lpp0712 [Legionella pneumophila str. Paris]
MKIPVQLKNIGGNIPENDIALQVSYFINLKITNCFPKVTLILLQLQARLMSVLEIISREIKMFSLL